MKHRMIYLIVLAAGVLLAGAASAGAASPNRVSDVPVLASFSVTPALVKFNRINLLKITFRFRDDGLNLMDGYLIWSLRYEKDGFPASCRGLPAYYSFPFQASAFSKASGSFTFYASLLAENCDQIRFKNIRVFDKALNGSAILPDVVLPCVTDPNGETQGNKVGQKGYDFTLFDKFNRRLTLSSFRGKVVLIDFSTMWCSPCIEEGHRLEQLYQAYKNRGFVIISAISENDASRMPTPADLRLWASRNQMTFPVVADPIYYVNAYYYGTHESMIIPYNVILDRQGRIALKVVGYDAARHTKIENKIKALL